LRIFIPLLHTYYKFLSTLDYNFYVAMHYSAKRGLAIACRLSVCHDVDGLWWHRRSLEFFENNFTAS